MKNIVIVGGGTAGWLTSLLVDTFYSKDNIYLIESDEIGILGAGEGTVPHFVDTMNFLGIEIEEIIKQCKGTFKTGIRFTNWRSDGADFYHGFENTNNLDFPHFPDALVSYQIGNENSLDDISLMKSLSDEYKVPFYIEDKEINRCGAVAMHFDARLLALYLSKVAQERGVCRVEGKIKNILNADEGNIKSIELESGEVVDCDFVFDCTGFARLLIGKHFNTNWVSYKNHLPLDSALPFFIPHDNNIKPETEAIAMKYGWIWKIPVQDRYGCGYVYDSSFISDEEVVKEIKEYFNIEFQAPKPFKFDAGVFEKAFVNNCMAVGLSQSFVEPLEATSIWASCVNLLNFLSSDGINVGDDVFRNKFNQECLIRNGKILDFIQLHYITDKTDSPFWSEFTSKNQILPGVIEKLYLFNTAPDYVSTEYTVFSRSSWLHIANGLNLLNNSGFGKKFNRTNLSSRIEERYKNYNSFLETIVDKCVNHREFLRILKEN